MRFRTVLLAETNPEYYLWLLACLHKSRLALQAWLSNPETALAVGAAHAPDLALFGVAGLDCPFYAAGRELLRRSPRTKVFFYARQVSPALIQQAIAAGAAGVASRGWTEEMVERVVASLLLGAPETDRIVGPLPFAPPALPTLFSAETSVQG